MPVYDVSAIALATDLDVKQLDNLLSRNSLPGVDKKQRGVTRRLTPDIAIVIRMAKELADFFGTPVGSMLEAALKIERGDDDDVQFGPFATLHVDRVALRSSTLARLDNAVEIVGRRPRGRPARRAG